MYLEDTHVQRKVIKVVLQQNHAFKRAAHRFIPFIHG